MNGSVTPYAIVLLDPRRSVVEIVVLSESVKELRLVPFSDVPRVVPFQKVSITIRDLARRARQAAVT